MIRGVFEAFDIDYSQWLALTKTSLKLDFRVAGMGSVIGDRPNRSSYSHLLWVMVFYIFTGIFFAVFILLNQDVFLTSVILATYVMFMTGSVVLIEYNSVVISPDDYVVLGYRPISSRTFFAARLANVLFYIGLLTTAMVFLPVSAYFFTLGFRPLLGLSAVAAFYAASFTTTLFIILAYTTILAYVHPNRLRRVFSYVQLATSFVIYGSYFVVPRLIDLDTRALRITIEQRPWLVAVPPVWFASYLQLALGNLRFEVWVSVFVSLALGAVLLGFSARRLSIHYSQRLGELSARTEQGRAATRRKGREDRFFRYGEARAIALLVWSQFRYDQKFRLSVLGILPLTLFYLVIGLSEGPLTDPFTSGVETFGQSVLVYLAVLVFPVILKGNLGNSDYFQASWVFFTAPARTDHLVLAAKNFVAVYFVLPYLAVLTVLFAYFYTVLWHALVQALVLGVLAHLVLQLSVLISPDIPFSQPVKKGQRSSRVMLVAMVMPGIVMGLLFAIFVWVYPSAILTLTVVAGLFFGSLLLEKQLPKLIRRRLRRAGYQG
jgi:ABC-2 type transport system permease protein